jgi:ABC-type glutathione transport system ATPase component
VIARSGFHRFTDSTLTTPEALRVKSRKSAPAATPMTGKSTSPASAVWPHRSIRKIEAFVGGVSVTGPAYRFLRSCWQSWAVLVPKRQARSWRIWAHGWVRAPECGGGDRRICGNRPSRDWKREKWQALNCSNVKKSFGSVDVIHGVDLTVDDGEFTVFVGPSGLWQIHLAAACRRAGGSHWRKACPSAARTSPTSSRPTAASPWCFSPTRSIRT